MSTDLASTLYMVAIALAAAGLVFLALFWLGSHRIAATCAILMFLLRFAAAAFLDIEPLGEASTFRETGAVLPLWLLAVCYFNQFGVWGAVLAFAVLRRRHLTSRSSERVDRS